MQEIYASSNAWKNLNENSPTIHTPRLQSHKAKKCVAQIVIDVFHSSYSPKAYKIIIFMKRLSELSHSNKLYQYKFEYNHSFMVIYSQVVVCFGFVVIRASGAYRYGKQWQCGISWKKYFVVDHVAITVIFSLVLFACSLYKLLSGPAYSGTLSKHYYYLLK